MANKQPNGDMYTSKQLSPNRKPVSKKDRVAADLQKLEKEEARLRQSIEQTGFDTSKLSNGLLTAFQAEKTTLPEPEINLTLRDRNTMEIVGDVKRGQSYGRTLKKQLETFVQGVSTYTHTGVYGKIMQARVNRFLEKQLPVLKHSTMLFIDDINNGSYRGGDFSRSTRFTFWKSGKKITDENQIKRMMEILNPKEYFGLVTNYQRFDDIDTKGDYIQRRDGNSCTRLVSHKEVAKELYMKYVLKEIKRKEAGKPKKVGQESWILESQGSEIPIDSYTAKELLQEESFLEFVQRHANHKTHRIYSCEEHPKHGVSIEIGGQSGSTLHDVYHSVLTASSKTPMFIGTESMQKTTAGLESHMTPMEKSLLSSVEFQDIYNLSLSGIKGYAGISCESEHGMTNYTGMGDMGSPLEQMAGRLIRILNEESSQEQFGLEAFPSEINPLAPSGGIRKLGAQKIDFGIAETEEEIRSENMLLGRLERMFHGIKGETVEHLDNTRSVPILVGDRFLGALYIEYTHQDIQHLVGVRTIMGSPASYIQHMDTIHTDTNIQEETVGRLAFSDIIKPILEQNMDLRFLKENTDILYTIQKLMQENELSSSQFNEDMLQSNIYNLSRVIFIPANELVFKREGMDSFGESKFQEALTPATCAILANESYLSWILGEGKGTSFILVPRGMSEVASEYGVQPLEDRIRALFPSRGEMRDMIYADVPLAHNVVVMYKDDAAQNDIDIKTMEMPEFSIDKDMIREWKQEATDIVGYNCALYTSTDGNIELASKLFEMNDTKVISLIEAQDSKKQAASILATRLLKLRGGETYDDVTVEWMPPDINKGNVVKLNEVIAPKKEAFLSYMEIMDGLYENNDEWQMLREHVAKDILQRVAKDDEIILAMDDILAKAKTKVSYEASENLKETGDEEDVEE